MANFSDDFNRGVSNDVGNSWLEREAAPGRLVIDGDYLYFTGTAGDEGLCYRARSGGPARNNTTIQYKVKWNTTVGSNNFFSVSGLGTERNAAGNASHRLHMTITATQIKVYDGATLQASANHGLSLVPGTYYFVRWDILSDYSMRVFINATGFTYVYPEIYLQVPAFTPASADGGYWEIGGGGSSADIIYDDLTIYDAVQSAPPATPEVETSAVTDIALTTATGNGEVITDNSYTITARGICWNTSTLPTIANNKQAVSGTVGTFTASMTGLSVNTHYYVRAYATNANGTVYGTEVEFDTLNIDQYDLIKDIGAIVGDTYAVRVAVTGTTGTVTVKLGTTGDTSVFTAAGGVQEMSGLYGGASGLILTRSADFDGTIDNVQYVRVEGTGTIDWDSDVYVTVFPISSEVFFKRIEDEVFNQFRFYRFLDLLFKDLDGYVTVSILEELNDGVTAKDRTFVVGNTGSPASPFSKKRISFLCKNQAIIIGLSNASLGETFAIAQFLLEGDKKSKKMFSSSRIISAT